MIYEAHFIAFSPDGIGLSLAPTSSYGLLFAAADHFDRDEVAAGGYLESLNQAAQIQLAGGPMVAVQADWQWCEWGLVRSGFEAGSSKIEPYLRLGGQRMPQWRLRSLAGYLRARATLLVFNEAQAQAQQQAMAMQLAQQQEVQQRTAIHRSLSNGRN